MKYVLLALSVMAIIGCQTMTQAQKDAISIRQQINDSIAKSQECAKQVLETPSGVLVSNEVLYQNMNSNKYDLMSSNEKLSNKQKDALRTYLNDNLRCREINLNTLQGLRHQHVIATLFSRYDDIYPRLLSGEITIGQANKEKKKALDEFDRDWIKAETRTSEQLDDAHNNEIGNRQRNAAIMAPLLNQKPYQVPMPQQANPIIKPTTNTNCIPNGFGGFNCTTR